MRREVEILQRWFPQAVIVEQEDWLPFAVIPGGVQVELLFQDGEPAALIERHQTPDGLDCDSVFRIRPTGEDREVWTVEQDSPLTLSPSIACTACGHHGWIREGRWVLA